VCLALRRGALGNGGGWVLAAACAAVWAGLLVACLDVVLLRIRVERVALPEGCLLALVGLGLLAMLSRLCPDPRHLLARADPEELISGSSISIPSIRPS